MKLYGGGNEDGEPWAEDDTSPPPRGWVVSAQVTIDAQAQLNPMRTLLHRILNGIGHFIHQSCE